MKARFVGQPFQGNSNLYQELADALHGEWSSELTAAVAWAKRSGLRRLAAPLTSFRKGGGVSELVLGIDERGATEEGLKLALELFDTVRVLNDRSGRTFHPKVYVVRGLAQARLIVGSNNLTAGGAFFNYEGAIVLDLDLALPEDAVVLAEVDDYLALLREDDATTLDLTEGLLETLLDDSRYGIGKEGRRTGLPKGQPEEVDASIEAPTAGVFGKSRQPKKAGPPVPADLEAESKPATEEGHLPPLPPTATPTPTAPLAGTATTTHRWTKKLPASDAQRPPQTDTNPTGNVRLTQAHHDIDWTTYFRNDVFGAADWIQESTATDKEVAEADFGVWVEGSFAGNYRLQVSHVPHREAGQANHTTVLHWGDLSALLRETDFTDQYLTIDCMSDGTWRLELSLNEPQPSFI